jgi:NADH:ubiquinone oxidoreductase subunit 4 (subunit M)
LLLFYRTPLAYIFLIINFLKQEEAPEELFILTGPEELLPTLSLTLTLLVKFPVYFLHVWLPKVHVEARTTASIILASLLLKTGTYGFSVFNKLYL